jgi:nicotinamidase-related amidase
VTDADLHADYRRAGFTNRLGFGRRPALVVVDFCLAYLEPSSPLYAGAEAARDACAELLGAARAAGVPVLHTRVEFEPGGANGGLWFRKVTALSCFERGNALAEPPPSLAPRAGETVVTKQYASGFFGTSLASTLVARQVDTVLIAGVSTSGCVRATALDALQHGFVPVVVREAVADRDPRVHNANLFDLEAKYADVVDLGEVTAYLSAR